MYFLASVTLGVAIPADAVVHLSASVAIGLGIIAGVVVLGALAILLRRRVRVTASEDDKGRKIDVGIDDVEQVTSSGPRLHITASEDQHARKRDAGPVNGARGSRKGA